VANDRVMRRSRGCVGTQRVRRSRGCVGALALFVNLVFRRHNLHMPLYAALGPAVSCQFYYSRREH